MTAEKLTQEAEDLKKEVNVDGNNYCQILTLLGMEEEGDPVAEVKKLVKQVEDAEVAWNAVAILTVRVNQAVTNMESPMFYAEAKINVQSIVADLRAATKITESAATEYRKQIENEALERAAVACDEIADRYAEAESRMWAEMKTDAERGAKDCADVIRALKKG